MEKVIKKYSLKSSGQVIDDRHYWDSQSIELKLDTVESLRQDALKLGLYPDYDEHKQGLRRVLRIAKLK